MKTSVGRTKLELAQVDITQLEVDAIATASGTDLWMQGGVAAAIKEVGGEAIEKEAVLQGPVEVGEAVATTGHDLKARWVIHVAVTEDKPQTDAAVIARATRAVLDCAVRCNARSVAIPAIGTGVCAFPFYRCSSIMVTEVVSYLREHPRTPLRHIMFVAWDDATRASFKTALSGTSRLSKID